MRMIHRYKDPKDRFRDYCCYCGIQIVLPCDRTIEHLVPVSKGGKNIGWNLKVCCPACNKWRSNKDYFEFLGEVQRLLDKFNKTPDQHRPTIKRLIVMIDNIKYWDDFVLSHTVKGLIPINI